MLTVAIVRPYRPSDPAELSEIYDVCVRTAAAGGDARGRYSSDDLMPDLFAGPYLALAPELAFVLHDDTRVVGYVLGTADTPAFVNAYRQQWLPRLAGRYPTPPDPPVTDEQRLLAAGLNPQGLLLPELTPYPAHLHIDLLPDQQGHGYGRQLITTFLAAVAAAGTDAVHLGMDPSNGGARAFYLRLGFHPIPVSRPGTLYLGRSTQPDPSPTRPG